jgi:quinolinate synthase
MIEERELEERIRELKREKNAIILAHNYQRGNVQDVADFTGDSLALSLKAVDTDAGIIVFAGVRFMAETASILNPDKKVLLPNPYTGCELAEMCTAKELEKERKRHPGAAVVSYVNSFARIKAMSDICCTSSNAVDVVKSLPNEEVLFLPDRNLASFVAERVQDKKIIPWNGYCYVHQEINPDTVRSLRRRHPDAAIMVHPECGPELRKLADFIGSTTQMQKYASDTEREKYIVGTEEGLIYRLKSDNPNKRFYSVGATCVGMKRNTLHGVFLSLEREKYEIRVPEEIRINAKEALDRMLAI